MRLSRPSNRLRDAGSARGSVASTNGREMTRRWQRADISEAEVRRIETNVRARASVRTLTSLSQRA